MSFKLHMTKTRTGADSIEVDAPASEPKKHEYRVAVRRYSLSDTEFGSEGRVIVKFIIATSAEEAYELLLKDNLHLHPSRIVQEEITIYNSLGQILLAF